MYEKPETHADRLVIEKDGSVYVLMYRGLPMQTYEGEPVAHPNKSFLVHMISEYAEHDVLIEDQRLMDPQHLSSYMLYCIQQDRTIPSKDGDIRLALENECLLFRASNWDENKSYMWEPLRDFLRAYSLQLPKLGWEAIDEETDLQDDIPPELVTRFSEIYWQLSSSQRAGVLYLSGCHNGALIWPIILVLGWCSPVQYASAVASVYGGCDGNLIDASLSGEDYKRQRLQEVHWLADEASIVDTYLRLSNKQDPKTEVILQDISGGETATREFKETLRWNIRSEQYDKQITHSCLKTVCAFLNTDGGTLYIGVNDSGEPSGLSRDGFKNDDKFLLHFYNVIKQTMGEMAATHVDARIVPMEDCRVCQVICKRWRGTGLVVLKQTNGKEESFVRTGPSTVQLQISEVSEYLASRDRDAGE